MASVPNCAECAKKMCWYFTQGKCTFGAKCKKAHIVPQCTHGAYVSDECKSCPQGDNCPRPKTCGKSHIVASTATVAVHVPPEGAEDGCCAAAYEDEDYDDEFDDELYDEFDAFEAEQNNTLRAQNNTLRAQLVDAEHKVEGYSADNEALLRLLQTLPEFAKLSLKNIMAQANAIPK